MQKKIMIFYILCLHLFLMVIIIKSNFVENIKKTLGIYQAAEITGYYQTMLGFHVRIDKNLSAESLLFIGDSHIQGLAVSMIDSHAVNYGIGGDTTYGVLQRLPYYQSLYSAKAVIVAIGFNDLQYRNNQEIIHNIEKILSILIKKAPVILSAIIPTDENFIKHKQYHQRVILLNQQLKELSNKYQTVVYLSAFAFISKQHLNKYHLDDGIHLNKKGYELWIKSFIKILPEIIRLN